MKQIGRQEVLKLRQKHSNLVFVPTMGALHVGHGSLVKNAQKGGNTVLVSIFVNPVQFNNKNDLVKYPRTTELDLEFLEKLAVDYVWFPTVEDIYPTGMDDLSSWDFGNLTQVMEAVERPGHFDGVAEVVYRFFKMVNPNKAFFGEKDFQQLQIIRQMVKYKGLGVEVVGVPTYREDSGLAYSSRNMRLTDSQKIDAQGIYKALNSAKKEYHAGLGVGEIVSRAIAVLKKNGLVPEYFIFAEEEKLKILYNFKDAKSCRAFVVAYAGEVRLIDNLKIF